MQNKFQTIFLGVFLAFFVFAVMIFAGILPIGKSKSAQSAIVGNVTIWGTFPSSALSPIVRDMNSKNKNLRVSYQYHDERNYQQDLIEAFALGKGPDLFLVSDDMLVRNTPFLSQLPYVSYPEKAFRDTFIDGADILLGSTGLLGMPVVVDPLVLYYNKDLLANEGIAKVPESWDQLFDLSSKLTKKQSDGTINQSMIGLGGFENINHAKDILALLLLQSGDPITERVPGKDSVIAVMKNAFGLPVSPLESVLSFYTSFGTATSDVYSWNRGLPNSKELFTAGKLAFYVGRASELFSIESINPNLSFDVTKVFQTKGTQTTRTYGKIYSLGINNKSPNAVASAGVMSLFVVPDTSKALALALSLPPVQRTLLASVPTDPYLYSFYKSAIVARGWLDPDTTATDTIFRDMIQNILSNKFSVRDAGTKAHGQLEALLPKQ